MPFLLAAEPLSPVQTGLLIVFIILLVQWPLAMICLMRLYKNKPARLKTGVWNVLILLAVWVGPLCYLILEKKSPRHPAAERTDDVRCEGEDGKANTLSEGDNAIAENVLPNIDRETKIVGSENEDGKAAGVTFDCDGEETANALPKPENDGGDYII